MKNYGVTHVNPDWDAIAACWLLAKYGDLPRHEIKFVNTGNPDPEILKDALFVVDTGKRLNSLDLRFDHHHLPGRDANDTCAAKQVWQHLAYNGPGALEKFRYLAPLVNLVFAGDTGRKDFGAEFSRDLGLHALLSGFKSSWRENYNSFAPDKEVLKWGFGILDLMDLRLRNEAKAKEELDEKVVYKSDDGLLWAIRFGSVGSSFAAQEQGARVVVFEGEPIELESGITYPVGIQRAGEWQEPNVGHLIIYALAAVECVESPGLIKIESEISTWYRHEAGFFAGRGTAKAPCYDKVEIDLSVLAELIDEMWER